MVHQKSHSLKTVDVSSLIQHKFNPKGQFNIISAKADKAMLTIRVDSLDDANEIKERILEKIGRGHKTFVEIWDFNPIQIQVSFDAMKALLDKLR